jgi:hypothetical protein
VTNIKQKESTQIFLTLPPKNLNPQRNGEDLEWSQKKGKNLNLKRCRHKKLSLKKNILVPIFYLRLQGPWKV